MNYLKKAAVCMTAATMFTANSAGFMPYDPIRLPAITANAADIVASGECGLQGNNVTWTLDSEGTLTISGEGKMKSYINFSAPWEAESINKVIIENGVTSIGYASFKNCKNLTSVSFPDSLITIYECAFLGCKGLSEISIPSSVTEIGGHAFYDTLWLENKRKESPLVIVNNILIDAMTYTGDVVIPDNVVCIGGDAFFSNYNITSAIIPDSVKSIESSAFTGCSKLSTITIPGNVESIGNLAFNNCRNLTSLTIEEGVTEINGSTFEGCASLTSLILPETLTAIGTNAFAECTSLKTITIPHNVTFIGNLAFAGCSSLESIVIKNPKCVIESIVGKSTLSTKATIYGYAGSTAQEYAEKYNRTFIALDEKPAVTTTTSLTTTAATTSTTTTSTTTAATTAATTTATPATTAPTPDVVPGDVDNNGYLDMLDASYIMSHINASASGQESILTADQQKTADINSDGCINSYDIYIINRVYAAFQTGAIINNIPEYIAENFNYKCADSKDGGYTAEEINASPIKPTLSIVNVEYKLDELADNDYIAEVTISADGFENVTALDFHVFYDDKLTPCYNESYGNKSLKADTLGGAAYCMFSRGANEEYNSIFLSLANTRKADINGDIIKLYFNIPRDAENGDEFILYPEYTDGDMLACGEDNKAHAYLFTEGLKYGTISIDGELVTTTTTTPTTTTSTVTTTATTTSTTTTSTASTTTATTTPTTTTSTATTTTATTNSVTTALDVVSTDCKITIDTLPTKTIYNVGEELDLDGGKISIFADVTFTDGENVHEERIDADMSRKNHIHVKHPTGSYIVPFVIKADTSAVDMSVPGEYPVIVKILDVTENIVYTSETFNITVKEAATTTTTSTTTTTTPTTTTSTATTTTTPPTTTTSTAATTTTPPTTTEPTYTLGDVDEDGKVDSVDASLVLAEYALIQTGGKLTFTDAQKKAADVNHDGKTDSSDASKILEYYAAVSTGKKPTWD